MESKWKIIKDNLNVKSLIKIGGSFITSLVISLDVASRNIQRYLISYPPSDRVRYTRRSHGTLKAREKINENISVHRYLIKQKLYRR